MGKVTVDCTGEVIRAPVMPEGWYAVYVSDVPTIEVGKDSGKKYIQWPLKVSSGNFAMTPLILRTTLDKGDDPTKSKRWLFHQTIAACKIEKVNDKYVFGLDELKDKKFWVKVIVKEESFNDNVFEKNEIKSVAIEPPIEKKSNPVFPEPGTEEIGF